MNTEIEKDLENNNSKDEEVQINVSHKKKRFDTFRMKYKKDKKKYIVIIVAMLIMLSTVVGTSYAYLRGISKTNNSVVISAGTIALTFQNDENVLDISNAVPMSDEDGLAQSTEYSFDVKNNGTIPAVYTITLDNTCEAGNGIDLCIPDQYIKVGIKTGNEEYKVLEKKDQEKYIIETGELQKGQSQRYKMKIWLDYNTPNTYNAVNNQVIAYKGKLGLTYKQGKSNGSSSAYPEYVYRYGTNTVVNGEPLEQTTATKWVASMDGFVYVKEDIQAACEEKKLVYGISDACTQESVSWGIGTYTEDYTTLNKTFFLKHNISNEGTVESSEVCFIRNNTLYCLKGEGATYNSETHQYNNDSIYYQDNENLILEAFGPNAVENNVCSLYSFFVSCSASGLNADASRNGGVYAGDGSSDCGVAGGGVSSCFG